MAWLSDPQPTLQGVNWKRNLAALWASQFISLSAFSFCLPFLALYIRKADMVSEDQVASWTGVLLSCSSIAMMVAAPIWGTLGDRYGRKMMLVRANLAGSFVLYLMGVVTTIEGLVVLRLLQGAFTGTVSAAQTLVLTNTPNKRQSFALGLMMAAVSAGQTAGNYFGGICAQHFGPVFSFKLGGVMLFVSTILVVAAVQEHFIRPEMPTGLTISGRRRRRRESISNFKAGLPVLLVVCLVSFLQVWDNPFYALYIYDLHHDTMAAATHAFTDDQIRSQVFGITGWVSAASSVAAMTGSIATGIIMDRKTPRWIWVLITGVCAVGAWIVGHEHSMAGLALGRSVYLFGSSALASAVIVALGRMTPTAKRGAAIGWSQTARSVGWSASPLVGAAAAQQWGWSNAYFILAALTVFLAPAFLYLSRRYWMAFQPLDDDPPSMAPVGRNNISAPLGQGRM